MAADEVLLLHIRRKFWLGLLIGLVISLLFFAAASFLPPVPATILVWIGILNLAILIVGGLFQAFHEFYLTNKRLIRKGPLGERSINLGLITSVDLGRGVLSAIVGKITGRDDVLYGRGMIITPSGGRMMAIAGALEAERVAAAIHDAIAKFKAGGGPRLGGPAVAPAASPLQALQHQLATGSITEAEFLRRRRLLQ